MTTLDKKKKDDVSSSTFQDQDDAEMLTLDPQEERTFYNNQGKTLFSQEYKAVSSPCLNLKKMYQPVIPQKDQRIFEAYTFQQLILNPDVELVGTFHDSYQFYLTDFLNNHNETCKAIYKIQTNQPKCYYELNAKEFLKKSSFSPLNEYGTAFVTISRETINQIFLQCHTLVQSPSVDLGWFSCFCSPFAVSGCAAITSS